MASPDQPETYSLKWDDTSAQVLDMMLHSRNNLFITGSAGTGKSTLLRTFIQRTPKNVVVLAPTGVAARNVNGQTIHSFFGFPLRTIRPADPDIKPWKKFHPSYKILKKADVIVIDEISMVPPDMLDGIDYALQVKLENDQRFGGKQIILMGDVFQLSPVQRQQEHDPLLPMVQTYKTGYFFSAQAFQQGGFSTYVLDKIYRQQDERFCHLLNQVRHNTIDDYELEVINRQVATSMDELHPATIRLVPTNKLANDYNLQQLNLLDGDANLYQAEMSGEFSPETIMAEQTLALKVGARVMMLNNELGKWVNGSLGEVMGFAKEKVLIVLDNGATHEVTKHEWRNEVYSWNGDKGEIEKKTKGTFVQYPMKLAWAITIHKSQGLTFEHMYLDMGRGAFASGQAYVAISRCKTLQGLSLARPLRQDDIIVDPAVKLFEDHWIVPKANKLNGAKIPYTVKVKAPTAN